MLASVLAMTDSIATLESFRGLQASKAMENVDLTISGAAVSLQWQNSHNCKCWN